MIQWVLSYLWGWAILVDQGANVLLAGSPDETLSSRAHRMRVKRHTVWGWIAGFINCLFFWQKDHCKEAYETELKRKQLPPEFWEEYQELAKPKEMGAISN